MFVIFFGAVVLVVGGRAVVLVVELVTKAVVLGGFHLFLCLSLFVLVVDNTVGLGVSMPLWSRLLNESLCPQQLPNKNPSAQVPRCLPSVLMHSHTNMHVPSSPTAFEHNFGLICIGSPVQ